MSCNCSSGCTGCGGNCGQPVKIVETSFDAAGQKKITITVPSVNVLAANTTPFELIPAPGVGKYINVVNLTLSIDFATLAYATNTEVDIQSNGVSYRKSTAAFLASSADAVDDTFKAAAVVVQINQALNFVVSTGDPITGDSAVKVHLIYTLEDI